MPPKHGYKPENQNAASFPAQVFSDSPEGRAKNLPERAKPKTWHFLGRRPVNFFFEAGEE